MSFASQPVERGVLHRPFFSGEHKFAKVSPILLPGLFFTHFSRVKKKKLKAVREGKDKPAVKFETSIEGVVPTTYR